MKRLIGLLSRRRRSPRPLSLSNLPVPVIAPGKRCLPWSTEGRSTRIPERAVFNSCVTTQGKTAGEALAENSRAMTRVIAALKAAGIAERDIQTSNLSVNPIYSDPNRERDDAARITAPSTSRRRPRCSAEDHRLLGEQQVSLRRDGWATMAG